MRNFTSFLLFVMMVLPAWSAAQVWTGEMDSNWNNPINWNPEQVPNSPTASVTIVPAMNQPVLVSDVEVSIIVAGLGTSIHLGGFALRIHGLGAFDNATLANGTIRDMEPGAAIYLVGVTSNQITFQKHGSGSFLSNGACVFNGPTVFDVKLTAAGPFSLGIDNGHTFFGTTEFRNQSPTVNMSIAESGSNTFYDDIVLWNSGTGSISFGKNTPFATTSLFGSLIGGNIANGSITLQGITQFFSGANDLGSPVNLLVNECNFSGGFTCGAQNAISLTNSVFIGNNTFAAANFSQIQDCTIGAMNTSSTLRKFSAPSSGNNAWYGLNKFYNCTIQNETNLNLRTSASTSDEFFGTTVFENTGNGFMEIAFFGQTDFNGDVVLKNTSSKGIRLGSIHAGGFVTLDGNLKTTGFSTGPLELYRLDQMAPTPNDLLMPSSILVSNARLRGDFSCTAGSDIILESSIFDRNNSFTAPNISSVVGCTFSGISGTSSSFTKTGGIDNTWSGNNSFGDVSIVNSSSKTLVLAALNALDQFNGRAEFQQMDASGAITPCGNADCYFRGDISTSGTVKSITFGGGSNGRVILDGNKPQFLIGSVALPPVFRRMTMNTSGTFQLNVPLTIQNQSIFTNGIIRSSSANPLIYASNAAVPTGSNASHVDGPVRRTSSDNSGFVFPVGDNGEHAPVTINPNGPFGTFVVQYNNSNPAPAFSGVDATLDHVSACEYWTIDQSSIAMNTVQLTLTWSNIRSCGVNNPSDLRIAHWDGAVWTNAGGNAMGGPAAGTISIVTNNFSPFTLGSVSAFNPLPIELLYFTAKPNGHVVDLAWATASEKDNDYFTVERSRDGIRFEPVLRVNGAGTSTERLDYADGDPLPLPGLSYYRLRQTDYNGDFSLSGVVAVQMPLTAKNFEVYPNPAQDFFYLDAGTEWQGLRYRLVNSLGQTVNVAPQQQAGRLFFSTSGLAKGLYFLELQQEHTLQSVKIIIR